MVIDDLNEIAEKERAARKKYVVRCCMAAGCMSSNSKGVKEGLEKAVKEAGLEDQVEVRGVGCMKLCCQGPLVQVDSAAEGATVEISAEGQGPLYQKVTPEDAASLIGTLKGGKTKVQPGDPKDPFFTEQILHRAGQQRHRGPRTHRVLHRGGRLPGPARRPAGDDPEGCPGFDSQERAARARRRGLSRPASSGRRSPRRPASRSTSSATRTRATPARSWTAACWRATRTACWKAWPSRAYAVGANQGFIYVRAEYPLAISRLQIGDQAGQAARACWAAASLSRPSTSISICASAPERSSAARRRR